MADIIQIQESEYDAMTNPFGSAPFLFRSGKQCELTINFDGEGYRTYAV